MDILKLRRELVIAHMILMRRLEPVKREDERGKVLQVREMTLE